MITEDEKQYIIDLLVRETALAEYPRTSLLSSFQGTTLPEELRQGQPRELVIDAVRLCIRDKWNNSPPWLVLLLQTFALDEADARIAEIVRRLAVPPPAGPNPLDSTILNTGAPFLNRTTLRHHLRKLATDVAKAWPILLLTGKPKSGKSYSANYIDHFSQTGPTVIPCRFEFDPELGPEIGPEQVARDLVAMMGRSSNAIPPPHTNQKLYAQQLAVWVLNEAAQSAHMHWFILDNFAGDRLRPDTLDFLLAMADKITTGIFPQRCRLILVGFNRALLRVDPGRIVEEQIAACSPAEVDACVREAVAKLPVAPQRVLPLLLQGLPQDTRWIVEINMRLRALIMAIPHVDAILAGLPNANYEDILLALLKDLPPGAQCLPELQERLAELSTSAAEL